MRLTILTAIALVVAAFSLPKSSSAESWSDLLGRADSLSKVQKQDSAITVAKLALEKTRVEFGGEDTASARVLSRLSVYADLSHAPDLALDYGSRCLAIREKILGPVHADVAASLSNLAMFYSEQGHFVEAETLYQKSLTTWEKIRGPEHLDVAIALDNQATFYSDNARYEKADTLYRRAWKIREKLLGPDDPDVATSLNSIGNLYAHEGRYGEAKILHQKALMIRKKRLGPSHLRVASSQVNLANDYNCLGRYDEAESMYRQALLIREKALGSDHPQVAQCLNNLGILCYYEGRYIEADSLFQRALLCREKALGPNHPDVASTLNNLARLYRQLDRIDESELLQRRALAIYVKDFGADHPSVANCLGSLATLAAFQGRYSEADSLGRKQIGILENAFGPMHPQLAAGLGDLAYTLRTVGKFAEAESILQKSLAIYQAAAPDFPGISEVHEYLARCYRGSGDLRKAYSEVERAFAIRLKNYRDNGFVLSERQALDFSEALRRSAGHYLSCFRDIGSESVEYLDGVYKVVLASKGVVSDGVLEQQRAIVTERDSVSLAIRDSLSEVRENISQLYASGPGGDTAGAYRTEVDSLNSLANLLETQLARRSVTFRHRQEGQDATAAKIAAAIPSKSILLDFMQYDYMQITLDPTITHYVVTVLTSGGVQAVVDLGEASSIDSLVTGYRKHMLAVSRQGFSPTAADRDTYQAIARKLYDRTIQPIEGYLKNKSLVFVSPDGALNLVSFAALMDSQEKYLTEDYAIQYLSSGRDLVRLKEKVTEGHGLLAMGDPDFDASVDSRMKRASESLFAAATASGEYQTRNVRSGCGSLSELKVESLPFTRNEVEEVSHLWEGRGIDSAQVFIGTQASEDIFKSQTPGKRVIHLATHGYYLTGQCSSEVSTRTGLSLDQGFVGENPLLQSGLLLAGSNLHGAGCDSAHLEDGVLSASEVSGMDLTGTDLVVLSACETGLGEVRTGEGVYGLRGAFQIAGARTVISSLWPVPDQATADVLSQLYSQSKKAIPERLRDLQLAAIKKLRASGSPDHPFSWGAFISLGDWR